jgi:pyrrolidone-carboxylate peptidase
MIEIRLAETLEFVETYGLNAKVGFIHLPCIPECDPNIPNWSPPKSADLVKAAIVAIEAILSS